MTNLTLKEARAQFILDMRTALQNFLIPDQVLVGIAEAVLTYELVIEAHINGDVTDPDPDPGGGGSSGGGGSTDPDPNSGGDPNTGGGGGSSTTDYYMPARGVLKDFSGLDYNYALQGDGLVESGVELYNAKSACALLSNSELRHFVCYGSGGDGIKWSYGSLLLEDGHIHTMGLNDNAHADGIQARGHGTDMMCRRVYFDMPSTYENGTKSNACVILQSATGPMGQATFEDCVFRGGNYTFMSGDKGTGNKYCDINLKDCLFLVEENSPQYGLFYLKGGTLTVENCVVAELTPAGEVEVIHTGDPRDFDFKAWHTNRFGHVSGK